MHIGIMSVIQLKFPYLSTHIKYTQPAPATMMPLPDHYIQIAHQAINQQPLKFQLLNQMNTLATLYIPPVSQLQQNRSPTFPVRTKQLLCLVIAIAVIPL